MGITTPDENTSQHPSIWGDPVGTIIVPNKVNDLLWSSQLIRNDFYTKNIIVSDVYGICIQFPFNETGFDFSSFQMQLKICIDTIYKDGIYFDGIDIKKFECALYGSEDEVISQLDPKYWGIRICSAIKKMSESQIRALSTIYLWKLQIKNDGMEVTLQAGSLTQIERMLGENYKSHQFFTLRSDLFHMYLWEFGIKYYGTATFLADIDWKERDELEIILKTVKWIIASGKKPTETIDDTLQNYEILEKRKESNPWIQITNPFPPLKIRRKPVIIAGKPAEGGEVECFFPKANSGQVIVEIIAWKLGKAGLNILGQQIQNKEVKKIPISTVIDTGSSSEFIKIETQADDSKISIFAKEDIYLSIDKQWRLIASRDKRYNWAIWSKTWSLSLPKDGTTFELQWDIEEWFHIRWYDIVYSGELHGKIFAQNEVTVRGGGIVWGTIVSYNGNISIAQSTRIQDGTRLIATNGNIIIHWDLNHATVIGNNIRIHGRATKCVLIGWNIEVSENNWSRIFAESFTVNSDIDGNSEYTILVYAGIQWLISVSQEKQKEAESNWEIEKFRISELTKEIDGWEILIRGLVHSEARVEIMAIPFLLRTELSEFLKVNKHPELLKANRSYWLQNMLFFVQRNQWVLYSSSHTPLTRTNAISNLESQLVDRLNTREAPRDPLYARWLRLVASVGQLSWHIFDYSDSGSSFILINNNSSWTNLIMKDTTVDITILDNQLVSFFVTRVENKIVKSVHYTFIAWVYITQWVAIEISKAVARIDTQWKWSK